MDQDLRKNSRFDRLEALVLRLEQRVTKLEYDACNNYGSCSDENTSHHLVDICETK